MTAKGGDVMGRTIENFQKPLTKEEKLAESAGVDGAQMDNTPGKENGEQEEHGSAGARATRGMTAPR